MAETILAKMAVQIAANTANFNKGLTKTQGDLKSFKSTLLGIGAGLGVAFGVKEVASFAFEVSKLAGEAEGVRAAFERLPDSQKLMERLKNATHDTVSELDLMKRSVQAANFGISLSALPKLLEFATLRAQQTGQSVDYLVDSIVTGIGRKSPLILDNLGISAIALKEKMNGVSIATASVGEVAEAVGKIATENLSTMGKFSDNASTKVQRLNAAWENYKVVIGDSANGTGLLGKALEALTSILGNLAGETKATSTFFAERLAVALKDGATNVDGFIKELQKIRREAGAPIQFNVEELIEKYQLSADKAEILRNALFQVNRALSDQERRIKIFKDFARGYDDISKAAEDFKNIQYQNILQAQIEQAQLEKHTPELKDNIEEQKTRIKVYRSLIDAVNDFISANKAVLDQHREELGLLESLNLKLKEFEEAKIKATSPKEVARLNDEIRSLRDEIDLLNASTLKTSEFFKQLEKGVKPKIEDFEVPKPKTGQDFIQSVGIETTGADAAINANAQIIASEDLLIQKLQETQSVRQSIADAQNVIHDKTMAEYEESINKALEYGDAIGGAIGSVISGQESAMQALKKLSGQIISIFLKQALAGIIKSATQTPGPPPVVLAAAAAGVAAISGLFAGLGASGGGGGGGSASRSSPAATSRVSSSRLSTQGQEIAIGGEFVISGDDLRYIINRNNQKSERRRG